MTTKNRTSDPGVQHPTENIDITKISEGVSTLKSYCDMGIRDMAATRLPAKRGMPIAREGRRRTGKEEGKRDSGGGVG